MEYELKFNQQEIQTIYMALGELPLKLSANLFGKIQREVSEQDKQKAVPIEELIK